MLRIIPSVSAPGAKRYFDDELSSTTALNYYLDEQEMAGNWGGHAAEMLGLVGTVSRDAFHKLCDNINPETGERLTARTKDNRRVGYDFNFHSPKLLTVLYALTKDPRIMEAFLASVRETMQELEKDMECRVREKGKNGSRTTGNMVWGEFVHMTTRPVDGEPDPHLHAHCFAFNATWEGERDMWKAADFGSIKRDARYFEAAFHARLSGRVAAMGYPIRRDGKGFWDIASIPPSVREKFSRRQKEIEELAKELGITDPKKIDALGAKSRKGKAKDLEMTELVSRWDGRLTDAERRAIHDAHGDADGTPRIPEVPLDQAMDHATQHLFERRSVATARAFAGQTLRRGYGAVSVEDAWKGQRARAEAGALLEGEKWNQQMVTTPEVLAEERAMIAFAKTGRGQCPALGSPDYAFRDPLFHDAAKDTTEQQEAIRKVLGSHDRVIAIRGGAGTGKTTLMREVVAGIGEVIAGIQESGHGIHAFAPTAEASRGVLRREGFANANTVEHLLVNERLQQQIKGQVLWVDEAGLLGARTMNRLFAVAEKQNCRVILTGDTKQHAAVERGDALRTLEQYGGIAPIEIAKIQRQRVHEGLEPVEITDYREVVKALSKGKAVKAFDRLQKMGAVAEFDIDVTADQRFRTIANDYLQAREGKNLKGKRNSVLAVSPTHAEGDAVTTHIRDGLKQAGTIGALDTTFTRLVNLGWTEAQRQDAVMYEAGQTVQFSQNVKGGFKRGSRYTVVDADDTAVTVCGEDGIAHALPLASAEHFSVYYSRELGLAAGDRIRITQNGFTRDRKHRLNNGAIYEVEGITAAGHIRLKNGWELDSNYAHLSHGYVTTSHASQGKTVDVVLIAQGSQSFAVSSLEQFYVSVSRGREQVKVYTDDAEALKEAITRSTRRISATELVRESQSSSSQPTQPHAAARRRTSPDDRHRRRRYQAVLARRRASVQQRQQQHERRIEHHER